jgi:hypothetical protein
VSSVLDQALAAVRAEGTRESGELVAATRIRVRRSLEGHARRRHRMTRYATIMFVLLVSTVSWALSTGRIPLFVERRPVSSDATLHLEPPALPAPEKVAIARPRVTSPAPVTEIDPKLAAVPDVAWETPPAEVRPAPPAPVKRAARPKPAEVLYRKAHELHFHGSDDLAALAAWDAYLAAEPTGRFAIEARYNRGLVLVRLARYADARAALAPFASGDIGYRKREAAELVERLDQLIR